MPGEQTARQQPKLAPHLRAEREEGALLYILGSIALAALIAGAFLRAWTEPASRPAATLAVPR